MNGSSRSSTRPSSSAPGSCERSHQSCCTPSSEFFVADMLRSGCWLSDPLNHYFGRRPEIFITAAILIATPIASGFTHSWQTLFLVRLIMGIGIGAKNATVPVRPPSLNIFSISLMWPLDLLSRGGPGPYPWRPRHGRAALGHFRSVIPLNITIKDELHPCPAGIFLGFDANCVVKDVPRIAWRLQLGPRHPSLRWDLVRARIPSLAHETRSLSQTLPILPPPAQAPRSSPRGTCTSRTCLTSRSWPWRGVRNTSRGFGTASVYLGSGGRTSPRRRSCLLSRCVGSTVAHRLSYLQRHADPYSLLVLQLDRLRGRRFEPDQRAVRVPRIRSNQLRLLHPGNLDHRFLRKEPM